jgi:transketolase
MPTFNMLLDQLCINTIRFLSVDAIEKANSGHPGLPMGGAPMAYVLWTKFLKHNPANPHWPDRDRFVLSAGHGSMLLYSLLHLTGYDLSLDEIKNFRQWESKTPGHPEAHLTPGVETTTGPLGQGISNAVGMAIAEAYLAAQFNRPGHTIVDHHTYVLAGDGDLMEGVASEACSLAGHLRLRKLIVLYDANLISLAGTTSISFTEDVGKRFEAYGWHSQHVEDGNDLAAIEMALRNAQQSDRPSLIAVRSTIGFGSPHKQGTFEVHGSPLGKDEAVNAKKNLGWPTEPAFLIPDEASAHFRKAVSRGKELEAQWESKFSAYAKAFPDLAATFKRMKAGELPAGWDANLPTFAVDPKGLATRKASEAAMNAIAPKLPELIGGSADLNPSTFTWLKGFGDFQHPEMPSKDAQGVVGGEWGYGGRNIHFGVREHAMGAAINGMALHGGLIPYTATFLIFSDYMRPAIRLAAISELHTIFVFTHDSIGLGEDGPTHQAVEHIMSLRAVPHLVVIRPADANEAVEAWRVAIQYKRGPVVLAFTRQNLPVFDRAIYAPANGLQHGAYILSEAGNGKPEAILIGTGSEVQLAIEAQKQLAVKNVFVRVVSMPSWELFEQQPRDFRESVLPSVIKARVSIEAGITLGWQKYVGDAGIAIGLDRYGASAPGKVIFEKLGFTAENVVMKVMELLGK